MVVHVHFGMSGVWAVFDTSKEEVPAPTDTTRLRMEDPKTGIVTHLSAMTVSTHSKLVMNLPWSILRSLRDLLLPLWLALISIHIACATVCFEIFAQNRFAHVAFSGTGCGALKNR